MLRYKETSIVHIVVGMLHQNQYKDILEQCMNTQADEWFPDGN